MPQCPLQARRCGGCTRLSVPYPRQLEAKQKKLRLLFPGEEVLPVLGMKSPYRYRNKIIAAAAYVRGQMITGQYVYGTHYVLDQTDCLLENEEAVRVMNAVREVLDNARVPVWQEDRRTGILRFIQIRHACGTGETLVTLITGTPSFPHGAAIAEQIAARCPNVRSVVHNINPRGGSAVLGKEDRLLFGSGVISDRLCGLKVLLSSQAFYQINSSQAARLYQEALRLADIAPDETVLDLYCGIGLIGMLAASKARQVIGIEQNASAVSLAERIRALNGIDNIRFIRGDAGAVVNAENLKADTVIVDPPRAGLSDGLIDILSRMQPRKLLYISCDPTTQARDLKCLRAAYPSVLSPIRPVDMFPHTDHVETVCCLYHQKKDFISVPYEHKDSKYLK